MKTLLVAASVAALFTLPAQAQRLEVDSAQVSRSTVVPWDAVIEDGKVIGQDPDANVRLELRRDYPSIDR